MSYFAIDIIQEEIKEMDSLLKKQFSTNFGLISEAVKNTVLNGGKRLRPILLLLCAKCGKNYDKVKAINLACAVELIHSATLIHDDIVDDSKLRRGLPTLQSLFGKDAAVYAGDYVLIKAFNFLNSIKDFDIINRFSRVLEKMVIGEIKQKEQNFKIISFADYLKRVKKKTALLFGLSCEVGAIISSSKNETITALKNYGINFGMAFQIIDDILDFTGQTEVFGKSPGNDLKEGVITLPLLYAISLPDYKKVLLELIEDIKSGKDSSSQIVKIVRESGAIDYSKQIAKKFLDRSISNLSQVENLSVKSALEFIALSSIERTF